MKSVGSPRIKKKREEFTSLRRQTFYKQQTPQLLGTCVGSVVGAFVLDEFCSSPFLLCDCAEACGGPNLWHLGSVFPRRREGDLQALGFSHPPG